MRPSVKEEQGRALLAGIPDTLVEPSPQAVSSEPGARRGGGVAKRGEPGEARRQAGWGAVATGLASGPTAGEELAGPHCQDNVCTRMCIYTKNAQKTLTEVVRMAISR